MKLEDHTAIFKDVLPEGFCEHLIENYKDAEKNTLVLDRNKNEGTTANRKSGSYFFLRHTDFQKFNGELCNKVILDSLHKCYEEYSDHYATLKDGNPLYISEIKMQCTGPGQGYHVWHHEQGQGPGSLTRAVVFMLYLNDLSEEAGGETEFLHQRKRYSPQKNTLLLWPASYTHAHRGNTVLTEEYKYIITGWMTF
jgi:hypothetical protein